MVVISTSSQSNRIKNLRILCPNCHQQTDNWGGKNQLRRPKVGH